MIRSIPRSIKYYTLRIKRLRGNPKALAGGIAIGVLIGLSPTIPLHTVLIVALGLATRSSILAGILVSWLICNPITFFPIYYIAVLVGNYLTPYELNLERVEVLVDQITTGGSLENSMTIIFSLGAETIVVLLVGGFVFALPFSFLSYYLAMPFFKRRQEVKESKYHAKNIV